MPTLGSIRMPIVWVVSRRRRYVVTISFSRSTFTRLATEVVDGPRWSAGVVVGAATGCVAGVGANTGREHSVAAIPGLLAHKPGATCRQPFPNREPLAFAAWLAFPQQTKPPRYPDGFALEVRTTGVLSRLDSNRFVRVPQQTRPRVFSAGKWIGTRMWLPLLPPFENLEAKPEGQI
jgi:hypothetical protein